MAITEPNAHRLATARAHPVGEQAVRGTVKRVVAIGAGLVALVGAVAGGMAIERARRPAESGAERRVLFYRNPMDPTVTSPVPAKDSMGMEYVPVYEGEAGGETRPAGAGPGAIRIDPRVEQNTGVTAEAIERRAIERTLRTVGFIAPDERQLQTVTVRFAGWIEGLVVNFTGQRVKRGQPLARIYSPELLATQAEYLEALRGLETLEAAAPQLRRQAEELVAGARRRLLLWNVTPAQIEALERSGRPERAMTVFAPAGGVVTERLVAEGDRVEPGMPLFRLADLDEVWVYAEAYQHQLPWVREGDHAIVRVPGRPGEPLHGRIAYVQPVVSAETRTVQLRIPLDQPGPELPLKPNLFVTVDVITTAAPEAVAIPEQAILHTGARDIAVVSLGDGWFEPRQLRLGVAGDRYVEVLEGLRPGEQIVTSAQFLIDSEANLSAGLAAFTGGHQGHGAGTKGTKTPAPPEGQGPPPGPEPPSPPTPHEGHDGPDAAPAPGPPGHQH